MYAIGKCGYCGCDDDNGMICVVHAVLDVVSMLWLMLFMCGELWVYLYAGLHICVLCGCSCVVCCINCDGILMSFPHDGWYR